jgi:hypothetical protein
MVKNAALVEEAKQMYVQEGFTLAKLSSLLKVSKGSLIRWKAEEDWGKARAKYRASERHFVDLMNQIKYKLAKRLLDNLNDPQKAADPQAIYSLSTIIRALKPSSAIELKKMEEEKKKEITPEEREDIINEALESIYGIKRR